MRVALLAVLLSGCTCLDEAERALDESVWQYAGDASQAGPGLGPFEKLPPLPAAARGRARYVEVKAPGNWVRLEPGSFTMGSPEEEPGRLRWEIAHEVTLSRPFLIQITEVTQQHFVEVTRRKVASFRHCGPHCPMETVSWHEAMAFCAWITARLRQAGTLPDGTVVRLPTEWEWERAARGTDGRAFPWRGRYEAGRANIDETWDLLGEESVEPHYLGRTSAVGIYPHGEAPYGALDMSGNVW